MRRLCHREWNWQWNWQSVNHIPGIHDNGPRDHGVWRLTLTASCDERVCDTETMIALFKCWSSNLFPYAVLPNVNREGFNCQANAGWGCSKSQIMRLPVEPTRRIRRGCSGGGGVSNTPLWIRILCLFACCQRGWWCTIIPLPLEEKNEIGQKGIGVPPPPPPGSATFSGLTWHHGLHAL